MIIQSNFCIKPYGASPRLILLTYSVISTLLNSWYTHLIPGCVNIDNEYLGIYNLVLNSGCQNPVQAGPKLESDQGLYVDSGYQKKNRVPVALEIIRFWINITHMYFICARKFLVFQFKKERIFRVLPRSTSSPYVILGQVYLPRITYGEEVERGNTRTIRSFF